MCAINGTVKSLIFCSAPDVPTIVMASSKESQSITVEFTSVSGATSYILRAETNDGSFFSEISVPGSPGTVTNLQPYTDYTLSVMSVNSAGRSQPSISVEAKTGILFYSLFAVFDLEAKEIIHSWWDRDGYSLTLTQCCNLILSLRKIRISYMADLMGLIFSSMHSLCSHFQWNGFLTHLSVSNNIWVCSVGKIWEVELWQKGWPLQGTGHRKWILCLHLRALSSFVSLFM